MIRKLYEMGIVRRDSTYITTLGGDYLSEAPFLSTALFYSFVPQELGVLPLMCDYDPKKDAGLGLLPGVGGRFIGATIDPWTGVVLDKSAPKPKETQTNFFHSMLLGLMLAYHTPEGDVIGYEEHPLFPADLRRNFLLVAGAAGYLEAYGIQDEALKKLYQEHRAKIMGFLIDRFGITQEDIARLFPKLGEGHTYTSIGSALGEVHKVIRELGEYFKANPDEHAAFQNLVNDMAREVEEHLFPTGSLPRAILTHAQEGNWGKIKQAVIEGAFQDEATSQLAVHLLQLARYPEEGKILKVLSPNRTVRGSI